jgi:hypothetical protein
MEMRLERRDNMKQQRDKRIIDLHQNPAGRALLCATQWPMARPPSISVGDASSATRSHSTQGLGCPSLG